MSTLNLTDVFARLESPVSEVTAQGRTNLSMEALVGLSIAISLKRIADEIAGDSKKGSLQQAMYDIAHMVRGI